MLRPSALWHYYRARLRIHPLEELLALVGIATGVALIFAVQVATTSVTGSVEKLAGAVTGNATVQVAARDTRGVPERIADQVREMPGVQTAAAVLEHSADLRGPGGSRPVELVGVTPDLALLEGPLTQSLGKDGPTLSDAVLLPAPLAESIGVEAGDRAVVQSAGGSVRAPVSARLGVEQIGDFVNSPLAIAPLAYAQRLTGLRERISRILVAASPGREASVRADLDRRFGGRLNVRGVDEEARLVRDAARPVDQSARLFAAISALVGLLFAFNAMLLTVPERRRFLAELRMQGFSTRQVTLQVVFEALLLGLAASVVGLLVGDQMSRHFFEPAPGYLAYAFPVGGQRIVPFGAVLLALAAGLVATLLAGLRPLVDIVARSPIDAIYRTRGEPTEGVGIRSRVLLFGAGLALLVVTTLVVSRVPALTVVGAATLAIALVLVVPLLLGLLVRLGWRLSGRPRGGLLMVSMSELEAAPTRSVALAVTAALALFGTVAIEGAHRDLTRGLDHTATGVTDVADLWVTLDAEENTLTTMPFSAPGLASRLARTPGVAEVRRSHGSFLDVAKRRLWVIGRPPEDRFQIPPGQVVEGDAGRAAGLIRRGGWMAVSEVVATQEGVGIGDALTLPAPAGPRSFRVAALLTNVGWSPGALILNANDYADAWNEPDPTALQVYLGPRVTPAQGSRLVEDALRGEGSLVVETADERAALLRASTRRGLSRLSQISNLALIAAILALATAMSMSIWQRRPRLAELKLQGFGVWQIGMALLMETLLLLGLGAVLGALFGLYGQALGTRWLELATGFPTIYEPAGLLALATLTLVSLVAVLIAAIPGCIASNVPLTLSFRED